MPSGTHEVVIDLPIEKVWNFVKDMDKWAPLVPGYMEHVIISDEQSTWTFKGDLGMVQKIIKLQIDIKEWIEPTTVKFDLTGLNENFAGDGYFLAEVITGNQTKMIGYLDITAKGMMGPMINGILKSFVPKTTVEFTDKIAEEIVVVSAAEAE